MEQKSYLIHQQLLMDYPSLYGVLRQEMLQWQIIILQLESIELAHKYILTSSLVEIERKPIINSDIFMEVVLYQPPMVREHLPYQERETDS